MDDTTCDKKKLHGRKLRLELGEGNSCKLLAAAITAMPYKQIHFSEE
jgi:hypothetical protein